MKKCTLDRVSPVGISYKDVERVTDTAGFEPLDVKIKRFMISGEVARLKAEQFDSVDYRQMLDGIPDGPGYDPEDDLEEIYNKLRIISKNQAEILARKRAEEKEPEKTSSDTVVSETTPGDIAKEDDASEK